MDGTYKLGSNLSCGFRWNALWKHMTGDGQLTGLLISQFIQWPLAFTEVYVQPSFILQTTIVLERYKVSPFRQSKSQGTKMGKGQHRVTIWRNLVVLNQVTLHIKFQANQPSGSEMFYGFYHIWAWVPCLACDHDHLNKSQNFIFSGCCIWNLIEIGPVVSEEELSENVDKHSIRVILGHSHSMTLAFGIPRDAYHRVPLFWKNTMFHLFSIQKPKGPIWPWRTIGQSEPRATIWTNSLVPSHPMLHAKLQGNRSSDTGDDVFLRFLSYMGIVAILIMRPASFEQIFNLPLLGCCKWNLIGTDLVVTEEK